MIGRPRIVEALRILAQQNEILSLQVEVADAKATAALHFSRYAISRKAEDLEVAQQASQRFDELAARMKAAALEI